MSKRLRARLEGDGPLGRLIVFVDPDQENYHEDDQNQGTAWYLRRHDQHGQPVINEAGELIFDYTHTTEVGEL